MKTPDKTPPAAPSGAKVYACAGRSVVCDGSPKMMGIVNVTADSFFDGGRYTTMTAALQQAEQLIAEGATILDIGGQSTRPGYTEVPAEEEIERVVPVIRALSSRTDILISVDTYKPAVARAALDAGAHILNDIHGFQDAPELAAIAAAAGAGVVLMHNDPSFKTSSGDLIEKIRSYFERSFRIAESAGVPQARIMIDPGVGFGKTQEQNLEIMARLSELGRMGVPVLLAASRKSVIGNVLALPPEERLEGTLATTALAVWQGVEFIRVHDVRANLRTARIAAALRNFAKP